MNIEKFVQKANAWSHSSWTKGDLLKYWAKGGITPHEISKNKKLLAKQSSIIAILGSVGKTTLSKLLVALFQSNDKKCYEPKINDNWLPQLPFAVELAKRSSAEYSIFECGVARRGDANLMGQIVPSDLVIFTPFEQVHVGYLGNLEDIAKEKFSFIHTSNPKEVLVHESNRKFAEELDDIQFYGGTSSRFFGEVKLISETETEIEISGQGKKTFFIPEGGYHLKTAFEGALEIYSRLTSNKLDEIVFNPIHYNPPAQRMQRISKGDNSFIIDTANANELSIINSIKSFIDLRSKKRKGIVLGEIHGMGDRTLQIMDRIIKKISLIRYGNVQEIFFIGDHYCKHHKDLEAISLKTSFYRSQEEFENSNCMNNLSQNLILFRGPTKMGNNFSSLVEGYDIKSDETYPEDLLH